MKRRKNGKTPRGERKAREKDPGREKPPKRTWKENSENGTREREPGKRNPEEKTRKREEDRRATGGGGAASAGERSCFGHVIVARKHTTKVCNKRRFANAGHNRGQGKNEKKKEDNKTENERRSNETEKFLGKSQRHNNTKRRKERDNPRRKHVCNEPSTKLQRMLPCAARFKGGERGEFLLTRGNTRKILLFFCKPQRCCAPTRGSQCAFNQECPVNALENAAFLLSQRPGCALGARSVLARCSRGARSVRAQCPLGVRSRRQEPNNGVRDASALRFSSADPAACDRIAAHTGGSL